MTILPFLAPFWLVKSHRPSRIDLFKRFPDGWRKRWWLNRSTTEAWVIEYLFPHHRLRACRLCRRCSRLLKLKTIQRIHLVRVQYFHHGGAWRKSWVAVLAGSSSTRRSRERCVTDVKMKRDGISTRLNILWLHVTLHDSSDFSFLTSYFSFFVRHSMPV